MNGELLDGAVAIGYAVLGVAIVLTLARVLRGPTLLDRVVGLDLLAFVAVALVAIAAIDRSERALIDVGLTIALVAFIGTVVFARFLEQEGRRD